jgi:hypothetical protein
MFGSLLFTFAERYDRFEIDLIDECHNTLEPSLVVFGRLAIFLEGDNNLGLYSQYK